MSRHTGYSSVTTQRCKVVLIHLPVWTKVSMRLLPTMNKAPIVLETIRVF